MFVTKSTASVSGIFSQFLIPVHFSFVSYCLHVLLFVITTAGGFMCSWIKQHEGTVQTRRNKDWHQRQRISLFLDFLISYKI